MKPITIYGILACLIFPFISLGQENNLQLCQDGIDNDGDGRIDCDDEDCLAFSECVERSVFIPNVFSPTGKGINDIFMIYGGRGVAVVRYFGIYNRFGQQLFEAKNFPPNDPIYGWNGTYKGVNKNPGVFLYVARIEFTDGTNQQYAGDFTLMR